MLEAVKEANSPYELRFLTIAKAENAKHLETLFEAMKKSRSGVCFHSFHHPIMGSYSY